MDTAIVILVFIFITVFSVLNSRIHSETKKNDRSGNLDQQREDYESSPLKFYDDLKYTWQTFVKEIKDLFK